MGAQTFMTTCESEILGCALGFVLDCDLAKFLDDPKRLTQLCGICGIRSM